MDELGRTLAALIKTAVAVVVFGVVAFLAFIVYANWSEHSPQRKVEDAAYAQREAAEEAGKEAHDREVLAESNASCNGKVGHTSGAYAHNHCTVFFEGSSSEWPHRPAMRSSSSEVADGDRIKVFGKSNRFPGFWAVCFFHGHDSLGGEASWLCDSLSPFFMRDAELLRDSELRCEAGSKCTEKKKALAVAAAMEARLEKAKAAEGQRWEKEFGDCIKSGACKALTN